MNKKLPFTEDFPIIQAPMAGFTDYPFRLICRETGADFSFTEMVSASAMFHQNRKCHTIIHSPGDETKSVSAQVFGSDLEHLCFTAEVISSMNRFAGIDLNLGCWVKKIVKSKSGCYLMQYPDQVKKIFTVLRPKVSGLFSCKIRLGFTEKDKNFLLFGKIAQECGLDFITLHGRTRPQGFSGEVDYSAISLLAESLDIPVIGNGNVRDEKSFTAMKNTGAAGIMVGRACIGNPLIFKRLKAFRDGFSYHPETELKDLFKRHGKMILDYYGEKRGAKVMRKTMIAYLKGLPGIRELRTRLSQVMTSEDFFSIVEEMEKSFV